MLRLLLWQRLYLATILSVLVTNVDCVGNIVIFVLLYVWDIMIVKLYINRYEGIVFEGCILHWCSYFSNGICKKNSEMTFYETRTQM